MNYLLLALLALAPPVSAQDYVVTKEVELTAGEMYTGDSEDAIASVGDLDGNGAADFLIEANSEAVLVFLEPDGDVQSTRRIRPQDLGVPSSGDFAVSVALVEDLGGGVRVALALSDENLVAVFELSPSGQIGTVQTFGAADISGVQAGDRLGFAMEGAGDLDGNGASDLFVTALNGTQSYPGGSGDSDGVVYTVLLQPDGSFLAASPIPFDSGGGGGTDGDNFGSGLANLGDLSGDGSLELAIGAPDATPPTSSSRGVVFILSLTFAGSTSTVQASTTIGRDSGGLDYNPDQADNFGRGLSVFEDLDGNGITDLAVGVPDGPTDSTGGAVLLLQLDASAQVIGETFVQEGTPGLQASYNSDAEFGMGITVLNDIDGDGRSEWATSARDQGDGRVYVLGGLLLQGGGNGTVWLGGSGSWNEDGNWTQGEPSSGVSAIISTGTVFSANGSCKDLIVGPGAVLSVNDINVHGGLAIGGTILGTDERLDMVGSGELSLAASAPEIQADVNIQGGYTLAAGEFRANDFNIFSGQLTFPAGSSMRIDDGFQNVDLDGGTLLGAGGVLDMGATVEIEGVDLTQPPDFLMTKNLIVEAPFACGGGRMVFRGITQTIDQVSPGLSFSFWDVEIESTAAVTFQGDQPVVVSHDLQVDGSFTGPTDLVVSGATDGAGSIVLTGGASLVVAGDLAGVSVTADTVRMTAPGNATLAIPSVTTLDVAVGGIATLASGTTVVSGNLILSSGEFSVPDGANLLVQGQLVFSGGSLALDGGAVDIESGLTIALGPGETFSLSGDGTLAVGSDLTLVSGLLDIPAGQSISIEGDAIFVGGELAGAGELFVDGNVLFDGTRCTQSPDISLTGSWTSDPGGLQATGEGYEPDSGTVSFLGPTLQLIELPVGGGNADDHFHDLFIGVEASVFSLEGLRLSGDLVVDCDGSERGVMIIFGFTDIDATFSGCGDGTLISGAIVRGDLTFQGKLTAGEMIVLAGGGQMVDTLIGTDYPTVDIQSSDPVTVMGGIWTIEGDLVQLSGGLEVQSSIQVLGDHVVQGGPLSGDGSIDANNFRFSASTAVDPSLTLSAAGAVNLEPGVAVTGLDDLTAGGSVTVATGASLPLSSSLTAGKQLNVEGVVSAPLVTVGGSTDIDASGQLVVGAFDNTFGGGATVDGELTFLSGFAGGGSGTLTAQFGGSLIVSGTLNFPPGARFGFGRNTQGTQISSPGAAVPSLQLNGGVTTEFDLGAGAALTVAGDVSLSEGLLKMGAGVVVQGDLQLIGGEWVQSPSVPTIEGDASVQAVASTLESGGHNLTVLGGWASGPLFVPTAGEILLAGSGAVGPVEGEAALSLATLRVTGAYVADVPSSWSLSQLSVDAGGSLSVSADLLEFAGASIDVISGGLLELTGTLALDAASGLLVAPNGTLRLDGQPELPARILGLNGGGYGFLVNGNLEARNFRFESMDVQGIRIAVGASLGAEPFDLRNGAFDRAAPGGVLLDIRRPASTDLRYLSFFNSTGTAFANVRTGLEGSPITLTNWFGNFAGEAFDDDPGASDEWILWLPDERTVAANFDASEALGGVLASWTTSAEVDIDRFVVRRENGDGSLSAGFDVVPTGAPGAYSVLVPGLSFGSFRLYERLTHGELRDLGLADGTGRDVSTGPFTETSGRGFYPGSQGASTPTRWNVGPGGFASVEAALRAGARQGVDRLELELDGGTLDGFEVDGWSGWLLIDGRGASVEGPVRLGPWSEISAVVLHDMELRADLRATSSGGVVVLDSVRSTGSARFETGSRVMLLGCDLERALLELEPGAYVHAESSRIGAFEADPAAKFLESWPSLLLEAPSEAGEWNVVGDVETAWVWVQPLSAETPTSGVAGEVGASGWLMPWDVAHRFVARSGEPLWLRVVGQLDAEPVASNLVLRLP